MAFALTSASFAACQLRTISNRVSVKPYIAVSRIGRRKTAVCQAETGAANLADIYEQISELSVDLDAFPDVKFFRVEAVVRPWRLEGVVRALIEEGIRGITVSEVKGSGVQLGLLAERYSGNEFGLNSLVTKSRIEVVTARDQVDDIVKIICNAANTGEVGDGKIFVSPVADIIRVRTAETGAVAERMAGGRAETIKGKRT